VFLFLLMMMIRIRGNRWWRQPLRQPFERQPFERQPPHRVKRAQVLQARVDVPLETLVAAPALLAVVAAPSPTTAPLIAVLTASPAIILLSLGITVPPKGLVAPFLDASGFSGNDVDGVADLPSATWVFPRE
jgi:hypothetical protein